MAFGWMTGRGQVRFPWMQNHDLCWFFAMIISSQDNGWVFGLDSYKMSCVETVLHSLRAIYTRDFPTWDGGCWSGDGVPFSGCLIPKNFFGWWVDSCECLKFGFPQQATPTHWLTSVGSLPGREFPHHQIRNCPLGRPTCSYVHHVFLIQFGPRYCRWPQPSWQASVVFFFKFAQYNQEDPPFHGDPFQFVGKPSWFFTNLKGGVNWSWGRWVP